MPATSANLSRLTSFLRLASSMEEGEEAKGVALGSLPRCRITPPPFLATHMGERWMMERLIALFQPYLAQHGVLYCIDGCNGFTPQLLALMAAQVGEEYLLDRVMVSRAYTAHQLVSAIKTLPISKKDGHPPLLMRDKEPQQTEEAVCGRHACLLVLGYDHLFYADDLPLWERRHLHRHGINAMHRRHAEEGLPLLVTLEQGKHSPWSRELLCKYGEAGGLKGKITDNHNFNITQFNRKRDYR